MDSRQSLTCNTCAGDREWNMSQSNFETWPSGCAFYKDGQLQAACVLGRMRWKDRCELELFDLASIEDGSLKIRKKIVHYSYKNEESFVDMLKELKKKTTVFVSTSIDNKDNELFHRAGYCGRRDSMSYFPTSKILYISHT